MKQAEYRELLASRMLERDLQSQILEMCDDLGWLAYHTYDSRKSAEGFPDLVMVKRTRIIFAELKTEKKKPTAGQEKWLAALRETGVEVHLWRPRDILDGTIARVLRGTR